jgi:beta-catenin-like protein 1
MIRNEEEIDSQQINRIVEEGENLATEMDEKSLIVCLKSLKDKINNNLSLRKRFSEDPEKYIDSEIDLHEEIKVLQRIAAYSNLIPIFIDNEGVQLLISILSHPNPDIINDSVVLIEEITDSDFLQDLSEPKEFLEFFISENLFDYLVISLFKLAPGRSDFVSEENQQFACDILSVIENFLDVYSFTGKILTEKTKILQWLINRICQTGIIDSVKLFSSEILDKLCLEVNLKIAISSPLLLKVLIESSSQRGASEEEFLQNIVNTLCSILLEEEGKEIFRNSDGIAICLNLMKENNLIRHLAVKILDYALQNSKENCKVLIESGGLAVIFSYFMGKGFKNKKSTSKIIEGNEEHCINIISSILKLSQGVNLDRLIYKFKENNSEKAERLFELYIKYQKIKSSESKFVLQSLSLIISFLYANTINKQKIETLFALHNISSSELKEILGEMNTHLGDEGFDNEGSDVFSIKNFVENIIKKL